MIVFASLTQSTYSSEVVNDTPVYPVQMAANCSSRVRELQRTLFQHSAYGANNTVEILDWPTNTVVAQRR